MSTSILLVYDHFKDNDGFLYVTYASQEMFGWSLQLTYELKIDSVAYFYDGEHCLGMSYHIDTNSVEKEYSNVCFICVVR